MFLVWYILRGGYACNNCSLLNNLVMYFKIILRWYIFRYYCEIPNKPNKKYLSFICRWYFTGRSRHFSGNLITSNYTWRISLKFVFREFKLNIYDDLFKKIRITNVLNRCGQRTISFFPFSPLTFLAYQTILI